MILISCSYVRRDLCLDYELPCSVIVCCLNRDTTCRRVKFKLIIDGIDDTLYLSFNTAVNLMHIQIEEWKAAETVCLIKELCSSDRHRIGHTIVLME